MLDEIFEMFQDRSRKGRGSTSGGLMGKIGRMLEGDSDDRLYGDRDRRFGDRSREAGYDARERGVASDDRRFDARGRDDDGEYRRRDDDDRDDNSYDSRNRRRRDFDLGLGDD